MSLSNETKIKLNKLDDRTKQLLTLIVLFKFQLNKRSKKPYVDPIEIRLLNLLGRKFTYINDGINIIHNQLPYDNTCFTSFLLFPEVAVGRLKHRYKHKDVNPSTLNIIGERYGDEEDCYYLSAIALLVVKDMVKRTLQFDLISLKKRGVNIAKVISLIEKHQEKHQHIEDRVI